MYQRINNKERVFKLVLASVLILVAYVYLYASPAAAQERELGKNRSIVQVSDSVYRFGSDNQYGAYVVGSDAIAVIDGHYCTSGTVQWLKEEIAKRHTQPVKWVILSHDHPGHICNSDAFDDTATAIGQKNIVPHIVREKRQSALPAITFENDMDLDLGGVTLNLIYLGPSHSDNLIQIHVPDEKVLIAIDMAKGKSLFPDFRDMDVHSTLRILKTLGNMDDVDIVVPGHGDILGQENFDQYRRYLQALRDEVLDYMVQGKKLSEIRRLVKLEEFSDYRNFDRFIDPNIVTMWEYLYRYREPKSRITEDEAVICRENVELCRTSG